MARISFQRPTDQPSGTRRLLEELKANLKDTRFREFRIVVAFAKIGPLLRIEKEIKDWIDDGKQIKAVFGVDHRGTSLQALEFGLSNFSEIYIAHAGYGSFGVTFHPKIYVFEGSKYIKAYIGSNNLTVGGTETNFEVFTHIELELPEDEPLKEDIHRLWEDALRSSTLLDRALLLELTKANMLLDETQTQRTPQRGHSYAGQRTTLPFPTLPVFPPSPIPKTTIRARASKKKPRSLMQTAIAQSCAAVGAKALVIQITPHHNGEIFLSKTAIDQNPDFFGWPFTGRTVPKRASNPSYPQRTPDPIVDLRVYDNSGNEILYHSAFNLNTVYYARKSEIRITVKPEVVRAVPQGPPYSIMVMRQASPPLDYEIDIYLPGSPQYNAYLNVCNQQMPGGGKSTPRRFGWL